MALCPDGTWAGGLFHTGTGGLRVELVDIARWGRASSTTSAAVTTRCPSDRGQVIAAANVTSASTIGEISGIFPPPSLGFKYRLSVEMPDELRIDLGPD